MWGQISFERLAQDLRYGLRQVRHNRGIAAVAVFTLALGIGATTVIFSLIDGALLHPFPYKDAGSLIAFRIQDLSQSGGGGRLWLTVPEFIDYREQNRVFTDMTATAGTRILYTHGQTTQSLSGIFVTTNAFQFLGVPTVLGRWITPQDELPGASPVFVMNYRLWQDQFHGDRNILGNTFTLNGVARTLVGVMPPRFQYFGGDVYMPLSITHSGVRGIDASALGGAQAYVIPESRRKPGVTLEAVAADLNVVAHGLVKIYPNQYPKHFNVRADSLASDVVGDFRTMFMILLAAVGMLLLIACSNVANLLLARATSREKEFAIRASMGASRGRMVIQLLVESFVIAAVGGVLGYLFAYGGLKALMAVIPPDTLPSESVVELNWAALGFTMAVTLLTTLLCGIVPALQAARGDLHPRLKEAGRAVHSSARHGRFRAGLVVAEVGLAIVLLAGAGLMMRSFFAVENVNIGFDPNRILAAQLVFTEGHYKTGSENKVFFQQLLPRIISLPGVVDAAENATLPPFGGPRSNVTVPGKVHSEPWQAIVEPCSQGWFRTVGVPLVRGRLFSPFDIDSARPVAVINQALARRYFGHDDPIGRQIKFDALDQLPDAPHNAYLEIIGIVADFKNDDLQHPALPEAFFPYTFANYGSHGILVRTTGDPDAVLKSVSQAVWAVDPDVALAQPRSLQSLLKDYAYAQPKFGLIVLSVFAAIGLALVIVGVFSVMAYSVSLQTREIGIRMALGAQPGNVLGMVLGSGLRLIGIGIILGEIAALVLARFVASQVWGVSVHDPLTLGVIAGLIALAGVAACVLPARRALQVDPLIALREE